METHGIQPDVGLKEITCSDCGHVYLIGAGQQSGTCRACGNVELLGGNGRKLTALSEEIVARRVLPRLEEKRSEPAPDPLAPFRAAPDGSLVEELKVKYQVEWQLWAALTRNFREPALHMAYLTTMIEENRLEAAAERYREHRSVMALLEESRWQAEVSDLMLERIEALAIARMPNSRGWYEYDVPEFLKLLPYDNRIYKVAWIAFGLFMVAKFLHLKPY